MNQERMNRNLKLLAIANAISDCEYGIKQLQARISRLRELEEELKKK